MLHDQTPEVATRHIEIEHPNGWDYAFSDLRSRHRLSIEDGQGDTKVDTLIVEWTATAALMLASFAAGWWTRSRRARQRPHI